MYSSKGLTQAYTLSTSRATQHAARVLLTGAPASIPTARGAASLHTYAQNANLRRRSQLTHARSFSSTPTTRLKEFFPAPDNPNVRTTPAAWPHPVYTEEQMKNVEVAHREAKTFADKMAMRMVGMMRWCLDFATGYKHADPAKATGKEVFVMDERKYMIRNIFLESIAGVPGMVAGMLRHMRSMRRMQRDGGWIETLLEESYNERMHLLTFMKMGEPGLFMRTMVLLAQGVWFNFLFVFYMISPRTVHRFVGYLEEVAVWTYTKEIEDLDAGKLPKWSKMQAPDIAVQYWNMPEGHRSMRDLLMYIRADEAKHREVNHTLGNLDQNTDPNPFVTEYTDETKPHPTKGIGQLRAKGWERDEVF